MMLLLALLAAAPGHAFPTQVGRCRWVHGRFSVANGSSVQRLWVIGTSHMLALRDDDDRYPPALQRLRDTNQFVPFDTDLFGDFRVCARERWVAGHLQHVRIIDARRLTVARKVSLSSHTTSP